MAQEHKIAFYSDVKASLYKMYPHAYLAGWNAASEWDLIDERALDFRLFSPFFLKDETKTIFGLELILKKIPANLLYGIELKESVGGFYAVSDIHKTVIDALLYEELFGGHEGVVQIIKNYFFDSACDEEQLFKYAKKTKKIEIVSRLLLLKKDISND